MDSYIVSLSLGDNRMFEIAYKNTEGKYTTVKRMALNSGDILTMEGSFQRDYYHRVPKSRTSSNRRYNLTWRVLVNHMAKCPCGPSHSA